MDTTFRFGLENGFMGNGGRGGKAFKYTWDRDLPYCDPLKERCPTSAHSRMILGHKEEKEMLNPAFLGRVRLGQYSWNASAQPFGVSPGWGRAPAAYGMPGAPAEAAGASDVHCYHCDNPDTFAQLSEAQAKAWSDKYNRNCVRVKDKECGGGRPAYNLPSLPESGAVTLPGDMSLYGRPLGQAPAPAPLAVKSAPDVPALLAAGVGGGAVLGWLLSAYVLPKMGRTTMTKGQASVSGAVGGAIGGLVGVGITLLVK